MRVLDMQHWGFSFLRHQSRFPEWGRLSAVVSGKGRALRLVEQGLPFERSGHRSRIWDLNQAHFGIVGAVIKSAFVRRSGSRISYVGAGEYGGGAFSGSFPEVILDPS
jgi:hypothetical protein